MADFTITKPTVGGSSGTWGTELNAALDVLVAHPGIKVLADAAAKTAYVPLLGQVVLQADTGKIYKCTNATGPVWAEVGVNDGVLTTQGDILIQGASSPARLGIGTAGQILAVNAGATAPEWKTVGTSPLTTKGDVFVYGSADARLPVGSNGQVLTADSGQSLGVKWATPSNGGSADVTKVALSGDFDVGSSTWNTVTWATEVFDDAGAWVSSAPTLITVPAGYTRIRLTTYIAFVNSTGIRNCTINKTDATNPLAINAQEAQNETGLLADTGWLGCAEDDTFYVQVWCGGGADLLGPATWGGPCWFQAEFI